jgi:hypothetical protein
MYLMLELLSHRLNILSSKRTCIQGQKYVNASQLPFLSKRTVFADFILGISRIESKVVHSFNTNNFDPGFNLLLTP